MFSRHARLVPLSLVLLLAGRIAAPAAAPPVACMDFLRMHGLLRRAAAACSFSAYNPAIIEHARRCFDEVGARTGTGEIYAGAAEFDRMAVLRGRDVLCLSLSTRFPMVVRP